MDRTIMTAVLTPGLSLRKALIKAGPEAFRCRYIRTPPYWKRV
jgi:hypothetical protein